MAQLSAEFHQNIFKIVTRIVGTPIAENLFDQFFGDLDLDTCSNLTKI